MRLRERFFPDWVWRLSPGEGRVALTFDDGPHGETTAALLETLSQLQIHCTLFVIGSRCPAHSNLIYKAAAAGHVIANHGFRHESLLLRSAHYQRQSLLAADAAIRECTGEGSSLFRPPWGHFNLQTRHVLRDLRYTGVLWSVTAQDWAPRSEPDLWQRLRSRLHDGAIVLLHDGRPTTESVIRLLPRLADEVWRRGWRFVPLTSATVSSSC